MLTLHALQLRVVVLGCAIGVVMGIAGGLYSASNSVALTAHNFGWFTSHDDVFRNYDFLTKGSPPENHEGKTFEFHYRNYLQLSGVKGGANTVSVHVEHLGSPLIERVELLAGSSIDFTALPPPTLRLEGAHAGSEPISASVNEPFGIPLIVRSNGIPIRRVYFSTTPLAPSVEIVEPLPTLEGVFDESVVVRATGTQPGTYTITIVAAGSLGGARTLEIPIDIRP